MSETGVYKAITAVALELAKTGISKNRNNQQQGYKFRGIDDVYNELAPLLAKNALCILPRVLSRECVERQTAKGGTIFYVTVDAEFDFISADDGSKHTVKTFGEAMDSADKATNKAMSAAYKYAAFQAFCIPTEGDNDADATTHEVKPKTTPKQDPPKGQPPKPELSEAQVKLGSELSEHCKHDPELMAKTLKDISYYKSGDKEGYLKVEDIAKPNSGEKFQRWIGASLGKLRELTKKGE